MRACGAAQRHPHYVVSCTGVQSNYAKGCENALLNYLASLKGSAGGTSSQIGFSQIVQVTTFDTEALHNSARSLYWPRSSTAGRRSYERGSCRRRRARALPQRVPFSAHADAAAVDSLSPPLSLFLYLSQVAPPDPESLVDDCVTREGRSILE